MTARIGLKKVLSSGKYEPGDVQLGTRATVPSVNFIVSVKVSVGKVSVNIWELHILNSLLGTGIFFMFLLKMMGWNRNSGLGQCSTDMVINLRFIGHKCQLLTRQHCDIRHKGFISSLLGLKGFVRFFWWQFIWSGINEVRYCIQELFGLSVLRSSLSHSSNQPSDSCVISLL